ncbi:hypothetical protein BU24DRAFT_93739 [Aaosphaeria arxii CBS 175.79]|uniref:Secreted protein n=1 Tax=Aaosphaeria arxii CBS 175.79 TaxID=1450172 RepID=A0A6A5X6Q4_9PLEO|nr:uncharacterized protein BU24DRAFT_93739 [Aaosphaeria arxii CBS 175.79]KAF2008590.1 hypothetical protein BU24DRAFT_93739 [Aaosphaeria arxii CBS 175.79]
MTVLYVSLLLVVHHLDGREAEVSLPQGSIRPPSRPHLVHGRIQGHPWTGDGVQSADLRQICARAEVAKSIEVGDEIPSAIHPEDHSQRSLPSS